MMMSSEVAAIAVSQLVCFCKVLNLDDDILYFLSI